MDRISGGREPGPHFEEAPPAPETFETGTEPQVEQNRPAHQEVAPARLRQPFHAMPSLPQITTPIATPPADDTQAADTSLIPTPTAHLQAVDGNMIEKEWVEKTKETIAETKNDPFTQKHEVSQIKADYIQKRFNKQIKTDESFASDAVAA